MSDQGFSEEEVAAYWNVNAGPWAQEVREGRDVARECLNSPAFLRLLGDLRDRDVLDAGCGEGHNTRLLARAGAAFAGNPVLPELPFELGIQIVDANPGGTKRAPGSSTSS
jgi:2-polyprenyl-3-methyl-5-hydroxy-6-metoxy-1,4-benzoquinol methylase